MLRSAFPAILQKEQPDSPKRVREVLHIAKGSLSELDTQFELAQRLDYLGRAEWNALNELLEHVDKMISGLIRHLRAKS